MNVKWNHRLTELIEDWAYYARIYTWQRSILVIAKELSQLPYRHIRYLVFARSLTEPLPKIDFDKSIAVRKFEPRDVPDVAIINRPSEAKLCNKRLARGHVGISAIFNDKLVGYAWACTKIDSSLERVRIELGPFDFLCTDAFTSADFRKRGIQTLLTVERFKSMYALGYKRAICLIEIDNLPSISVWNKLGSQLVGRIDFLRIGSHRYTRYTNG